MNLAVLILGTMAVLFAALAAWRFITGGLQVTIAIRAWLKIAVIFAIVSLALVIFL